MASLFVVCSLTSPVLIGSPPRSSTALRPLSHRKILRLAMRHDDRRGRLLGVELVLLAQGDADLLRPQQLQQLPLVAEIGAGRVAEGVAAAAIALVQHGVEVARLLGGEAELAAD